MQKNHTHDTADSIRKRYRRRLIASILYLIFTGLLWTSPQVSSSLFPAELPAMQNAERMYEQGTCHVSASLENLKFTGYTRERFHRTVGYFYYTIRPKEQICDIVLLSPSTCQQGAPALDQVTVYGRILPGDDSYRALLKSLADDLSWTEAGIGSRVNPCYLSEPDFRYGPGIFLFLALAAGSVFAIASLLLCLLFLLRPSLAPASRKKKALEQTDL